jgi:predicted  nucleic acid-binding Zn-ribbon protein
MPNLNLLKNIRGLKNSKALKNIKDDTNIGPIVWIGLIMIAIYFFFDNSFPILPIVVVIFAIYLVNNDLPVGQIMIIVLCVYLLYHALRAITFVITSKCGQHRPALMLERFADNNFASLRRRLNSLNNKISDSSNKVDKLRSVVEGLKPEICGILKQIDESNEGDYNSNIPEEESTLPADKQKQRAATRAEKAKVFVAKSKATYVKNHDNIPMLECFVDSDEIDAINVDISSTEENLNSLESSFLEVKDLLGSRDFFGREKTNSYTTTLNYNDRYIKNMQKAIEDNVSKKDEGFLDLGKNKDALESNPTLYVEALEDAYKILNKAIVGAKPIIDSYVKRIKQQKSDIATAKGPVTNEDVRKDTMDASFSALQSKPKASNNY